MNKNETGTLLPAATLSIMAMIMAWVNLPHPGNHGGPKVLMMMLLLLLWCGACLHYRFPRICRFFQYAITQSLGIAMAFWIFCAGELIFRMRYRYSSMNEWIMVSVFSIFFIWILLTGGHINLKDGD